MAQFRTRKTPLDGVLLIDKPIGMTSHDVVARVRRQEIPAAGKRLNDRVACARLPGR